MLAVLFLIGEVIDCYPQMRPTPGHVWCGATAESAGQDGRQRKSHVRQRYFRDGSGREDDVTEMTRNRRQLRWRKVVHFLLIQITKTYTNLSPCC